MIFLKMRSSPENLSLNIIDRGDLCKYIDHRVIVNFSSILCTTTIFLIYDEVSLKTYSYLIILLIILTILIRNCQTPLSITFNWVTILNKVSDIKFAANIKAFIVKHFTTRNIDMSVFNCYSPYYS